LRSSYRAPSDLRGRLLVSGLTLRPPPKGMSRDSIPVLACSGESYPVEEHGQASLVVLLLVGKSEEEVGGFGQVGVVLRGE
jgi:hypothetical protein